MTCRKFLSVELVAKNKPSDKHWYAYDVLFDGEPGRTGISSSVCRR